MFDHVTEHTPVIDSLVERLSNGPEESIYISAILCSIRCVLPFHSALTVATCLFFHVTLIYIRPPHPTVS